MRSGVSRINRLAAHGLAPGIELRPGLLAAPASLRYILPVGGSSLNPDEVRAAAATHHELGPEYQSAVIESFIDKVGREIDARVDSRLANGAGFRLPVRRTGNSSRF